VVGIINMLVFTPFLKFSQRPEQVTSWDGFYEGPLPLLLLFFLKLEK
jgi:hypothetical protein